ncbi:hypothetical protein BDF20DRAFT_903504 [Mycotypha africana]|uniref:uncharacterized protein n=1 Tax=Mycotypha africana TaxID=64632 RepID=UPI0022FFF732|nr:uncharacterized protein BDF20DRAFT_903504 [Mycotypha africana]KAI8966971.1 hypothetical protein BDF20DRAFT_903504 [Mycotypha africana]
MDGSKFRKRKTKTNAEDEVEFLDEEEQERLLQELREQNMKANILIQRGLVVIGCIISLLFLNVIFDNQELIVIPISYIHTIKYSSIRSPKIAAVLSIISILSSVLSLISASKIKILDRKLQTHQTKTQIPIHLTVSAALMTGCLSPLMTLLQHKDSSIAEFIFWLIPLILSFMYYSAFTMMSSVNTGIDALELSKYKYKSV